MKRVFYSFLYLCLVLVLIFAMVGCNPTTQIVRIIDNSSHMAYEPENLQVRWVFKTVPIVSDGSVGLGYAKDGISYIYCVNGYRNYGREFTYYSGTITEKKHTNLSARAEFTFGEVDFDIGEFVEVLVNFYDVDTSNNSPVAKSKVRISIEHAYSYSISYNRTATTTVRTDYISYYGSRDHFEATAIRLASDCVEAFDDFLVANNINAFYRK